MSRMFPFITKTWNPVGGECKINCSYCWAKKLIQTYKMTKYSGPAKLYSNEMAKMFKPTDCVFVSDMRDLFEPNVPSWIIKSVLDKISLSQATYLLLTKNPRRYLEFKLPSNCIAGATIETDLGFRQDRFLAMFDLQHRPKMVSIEPIMKFSPDFRRQLSKLDLDCVAIGYDNYNNNLDEPSLAEVNLLCEELHECNILVYLKTMREPISVAKKERVTRNQT